MRDHCSLSFISIVMNEWRYKKRAYSQSSWIFICYQINHIIRGDKCADVATHLFLFNTAIISCERCPPKERYMQCKWRCGSDTDVKRSKWNWMSQSVKWCKWFIRLSIGCLSMRDDDHLTSRLPYARSPLIRRANWMSFGMIVTLLAWMAQRLVSSNRPTR
jgi:histone H3